MWYHLWGFFPLSRCDKIPRSSPHAEIYPSHLESQSFLGIVIEDVAVYHYASLLFLAIITDSTLQHHFSSCLDHSGYFSRTKLFEKYENAAGLKANSQHLPIWDRTLDGLKWMLLRTQMDCSSFNLTIFLTLFWEIAQNPFLYCFFFTEGKKFTACFLLTTAGVSRKMEICAPICHLPLYDF